ncbi:DDRGK domain-containing protein 1 isoform X2 [Oryctolagus cuniculus]|uniref:DDRGK domain-containing protein 1 isoform X2 n=1 Tax=Oryctolagus cuniculus TaxID=9986 RepID=UPI003879EA9B
MVALAVYLVAAVVLVGLIFFLTRSRRRAAAAGQESPHHEAEPVEAGRVPQSRPLEPEEHRPGGRPRRRRDLGSRLQAQRRAQRAAWTEADENEEEGAIPAQEEEGVEKPVEAHVSGKIGAKKLRKLEEKQARKAQREAEEAEREERKRLESQREAEWKKEEERLRLEEEQKEEEERKAREEQAQREHEEYLKLKESFVVEEEGVGETMTEEQSHSFLTEFVNYIKHLSPGPRGPAVVMSRPCSELSLDLYSCSLRAVQGCAPGRSGFPGGPADSGHHKPYPGLAG